MIKQGATKYFICKQINKGFLWYSEEFQKFGINVQDFKLSLGLLRWLWESNTSQLEIHFAQLQICFH